MTITKEAALAACDLIDAEYPSYTREGRVDSAVLALRQFIEQQPGQDDKDAQATRKLIAEFGHGHVIPRNDGARARCTGLAACQTCQLEAAAIQSEGKRHD